MYIITRRDLSAGAQAAQATHAALAFSQEHPTITGNWHRHSQWLVILAAADEVELRSLFFRAQEAGLPCTAFHEPDMNDEMTAIAIAPSDLTRRLCANLPLALKENAMA